MGLGTRGMLRAMAALEVGDKAPAFALKDQHGKLVRLSSFKGQARRRVLLPEGRHARLHAAVVQPARRVPAAEEAQGRRSSASAPIPSEKQKKFDDKYGSKFPLLADTDHEVAEAWGVWGEKSLYGKKFMGIVRSAFVVDEKGKLAGVFYKVSPKTTVPLVQGVLTVAK